MQIGALSFRPYIYNTNMLSRSSLSKISSVGEDLLTAKTDYSALTDESLNENPLRKGQSANFVDILEMQMQMGRMNALKVMKPGEDESLQAADDMAEKESVQPEVMEDTLDAASISKKDMMPDAAVEDFSPISNTEEMLYRQPDRNLFQMQRAIAAYQANMIA